jgi:hypothetical protein
MTEATFFDCACFRPYLNPDGGIKMLSTSESQVGLTKVYSCQQSAGGNRVSVDMRNGIITGVHY